MPILSFMVWLPIFAGIWLLYQGAHGVDVNTIRKYSFVTSLIVFILSIITFGTFDNLAHDMQFIEYMPWISALNINYHLGIDGISLLLIVLTTFITIFVIIASWGSVEKQIAWYLAAFLILEGVMIGVFSSLDAILFYVFWEAMLIPMFLIIGVWGGERRIYATIKFFLYTFLGSVFMLVALLYMYSKGNSFSILDMHQLPLTMSEQTLIFFAFFLAFAVKIPMWPVHTWLPDAHVEAPTGGSVILAAIMLKMGGYGFLRFSLPITPDASHEYDWIMIFLSLTAVVYIGFVALVQLDMKKLIAYSSISHMGFVTLGLFLTFKIISNTGSVTGANMAMEGGIMQMISHGFVSGAMFLCVGVLYDRMHSRQIKDYGGVINTMPVFAGLMMVFTMANAGLPGTTGFVGEFLVIISTFKASFWYAFLAGLTLVLGAAYSLWMYKRVIFGPVANDNVAHLHDLDRRETQMLMILALTVIVFGIWPAPIMETMHTAVADLIQHITQSKLK